MTSFSLAPLLALALLLPGCAIGLSAFSPATTGTHMTERASKTARLSNGETVVAEQGKVFVQSEETTSSVGMLLGAKFGPQWMKRDGQASPASLGGTFLVEPAVFKGDFGVGLQLGYGSLNGSFGKLDYTYGGLSGVLVGHYSLGVLGDFADHLSLHAGAGPMLGSQSGNSDADDSESAVGLKAVGGITLSAATENHSYGIRAETVYDKSGDLVGKDGATHHMSGWSLLMDLIYGAF